MRLVAGFPHCHRQLHIRGAWRQRAGRRAGTKASSSLRAVNGYGDGYDDAEDEDDEDGDEGDGDDDEDDDDDDFDAYDDDDVLGLRC